MYLHTYSHTHTLQVGYNKDGVFVSFVQNCPICEVSKATGSVLYALPKWALYCGSSTAVVGPVYTGACGAVCVHTDTCGAGRGASKGLWVCGLQQIRVLLNLPQAVV